MFADGVQFVDGGTAGEQEAGGFLLFRQRDAFCGGRHEGGGATGDEAQNQIVFPCPLAQSGDFGGTGSTTFIGDGVPAGNEFEALRFCGIAVLHVYDAAGDTFAEDFFGSAGHGATRLACSDDKNTGVLVEVASVAESSFDGGGGVGSPESGFQDGGGVFTKLFYFERLFYFHRGRARIVEAVAAGSQSPSTRKSARP